MIDNDFKLLKEKRNAKAYQLYNLAKDQSESKNLIKAHPEIAVKLQAQLEAWNESVDHSLAGKDFPKGVVVDPVLTRKWPTSKAYAPFVNDWKRRPEYKEYIERMNKKRTPSK